MSEKHPTCPICGLAVLDSERYATRRTSEGPKRIHDRCQGKQTREVRVA